MTISTATLLRVLVGILAVFHQCRAQDFEVEGITVHQIFTGGTNIFAGGKSINPTNKFSLSVSGCKYKISVESSLGNVYETGFDQVLRHLISIKTPTNMALNGMVEATEIPPDDGTTINYLWLAYASECYFARLFTNQLAPIWMLDDPNLRDSGFTVTGDWQLQASFPHVPTHVIYLNDGIHRMIANDRSPKSFRYRPPFDRGFTNASYQVLASTNIGGLVIPTRFIFTRYYVDGNRLFARTVTQGTATVVRKGTTISDFRPQFNGRAITFDKRFQNKMEPVPVVRYWMTNGNWPEVDGLSGAYAISLKKYNDAKEAAGALSKNKDVNRKVILWVLVFLATLPPGLFILANKQKRKESGED